MAHTENRELLSIGVFLIILVIAIILYVPMHLIEWPLIPPLILTLYGCWTMGLAGMRASNPQKYERGPFSTFAWGFLLVAVGGAWFLYSFSPLYSLAMLLLVVGVLAIASALKRK